jgi:hypothetical protein
VASQLRAEAQDEAAGVYGFDDTHTGILEDPQVSLQVNRLLDEATSRDAARSVTSRAR